MRIFGVLVKESRKRKPTRKVIRIPTELNILLSYYFIIKSGDIYVKLEWCMLGYGNRQEARRHLIELHYAWASVYAPTESNNQVSIWPLLNFFFSHLSYVSIPTSRIKWNHIDFRMIPSYHILRSFDIRSEQLFRSCEKSYGCK